MQALNEKIIAGAALDVFEEEPLPMENPLRRVDPMRLILTPHNIGANPGSGEAGQKMAAQSMFDDSRRQSSRYGRQSVGDPSLERALLGVEIV